MANNLRKFQNEAEYSAATLMYPAVSWVVNGEVHFDKTAPATFGGLTVKYFIEDPTSEVTLFNGGGDSSSSSESSSESGGGGGALPTTMIVDGVEETPINTWRFETAGEHIVQYTFEDNTVPQEFIKNIGYATEIIIGDDITSIGDGAFSYCGSLTSVVVDSGNSVYDSRNNCNAIIETSTNTLIQGCQNTILPNSVTSIGNNAFSLCSGLTSITIPDSVTSIGINAFESCTDLTSVTIPDSVTSINNSVFNDCRSLTSVTIPDSVTSIGINAFGGCSGLTNVVIPSGVTSIGNSAFVGCTDLTSITVEATTPPTLGSVVFYMTNDCPIYVPSESVEAYKAATGWSNYASRIQAIQ